LPSFRCQHPTCSEYLKAPGYCPAHQTGRKVSRHSYYDQHLRDPDAKRFYNSLEWQAARARKLTAQPWCERCGALADTVHHTIAVKVATDAQRLDRRLLMSLCGPCHSTIEREISASRP